MFDEFLRRWSLTPEGGPIVTPGARLLPVRWRQTPAMLKLALDAEEQHGARVMTWWAGDGAARVFAAEGHALLLERAEGARSLTQMARGGEDDEACRILCAVADRLHAPRSTPPPEDLVPLPRWFEPLALAAATHGGAFTRSAQAAREVLATPAPSVVLHGDLHHDNVLDFGARGWLAIDPKRLLGARGFDFANIFTNPDMANPELPLAVLPEVFQRRVQGVSEASGMERGLLLRWVLAWTGLSAAWLVEEGADATVDLRVAALAAAALGR
ncbi:aminoglycoside phosphotransferase family protein [Myxococcus faecalis]|uniref:aminoglycoside phosphotransferase family protein n=1 Tax=Myxococcus faecalis TaxID=3115646 RepID=UPI0024CAFABD|nr:APH(6) family putative aminoglycoside O-phosphotransferase [Myxococcus sp. MH1]